MKNVNVKVRGKVMLHLESKKIYVGNDELVAQIKT